MVSMLLGLVPTYNTPLTPSELQHQLHHVGREAPTNTVLICCMRNSHPLPSHHITPPPHTLINVCERPGIM